MKLAVIVRPLVWVWRGCVFVTTSFYFNWALTYARWGQPYRALLYLNRALMLSPRRADIHYNRGLLYIALDRIDLAAQDLDEAIRLNPRLAIAYSTRLLIYTRLGKHAEAHEDLERAVELGVDRATLESQMEQVTDRHHQD